MTISEKIIARASGKKEVRPGEIVIAKPDIVHNTDFTSSLNLIESFSELGLKRVKIPEKIVIVFDHFTPQSSILAAESHKVIRKFAEKQGIKIYDVGRGGIAHILLHEKGYARPGTLFVSADFHVTTLGAFGCFAVSFGEELLSVWATGEIWLRVPESLQFNISGNFGKGITSRDLFQWILSDIGPDGALYKAMEFVGPTVEKMSVDSRTTLTNEAPYAGAKTGIMNPDEKIVKYVKGRTKIPFKVLRSDGNATYEDEFEYDVSQLEPQITTPGDPANVKPLSEVVGVEIDQALIQSCVGGRLEDLILAATVIKGKRIHPKVRMIVVPSTQEIYTEAMRRGLLDSFIQAGASVWGPTCGPCFGSHMGLLAAGEVCISSSTTNTPGRMGSTEAKIYLANPAIVAASALKGKITDPRDFL